jgi:hypothetical protein
MLNDKLLCVRTGLACCTAFVLAEAKTDGWSWRLLKTR